MGRLAWTCVAVVLPGPCFPRAFRHECHLKARSRLVKPFPLANRVSFWSSHLPPVDNSTGSTTMTRASGCFASLRHGTSASPCGASSRRSGFDMETFLRFVPHLRLLLGVMASPCAASSRRRASVQPRSLLQKPTDKEATRPVPKALTPKLAA